MFSEKLKKAMQDLNITQKQLVGMTGINKSSISQYLSGKNVPAIERQKTIATALGLPTDYFLEEDMQTVPVLKIATQGTVIKRMLVEDAAKLLSMNQNTVRKGLQQGVFPWGYAIKTSENRWTYFINAKSFSEIERISL